ncbi:MAG: LytTR family transcriptional regulator DNA-binding domain-containing protein [Bacteroidales bacterium]|nr:LytTR family transcriptional regulator DNA-binding domain-containing protein [Bacteroidales bacterium]
MIQCTGLTTIFITDGKPMSSSKILKKYEKDLSEYGFIRINHNTLVNSIFITKVSISKQERLVFIQNTPIEVSKRRVKSLKKWMEK